MVRFLKKKLLGTPTIPAGSKKKLLSAVVLLMAFFSHQLYSWLDTSRTSWLKGVEKKGETKPAPAAQGGEESSPQATGGVSPPEKCSTEDIFQNPENFGACIRDAPSPSCQPRQLENWNKWVGGRYAQLSQCVTPEYIATLGKTFAVSGRGSTVAATEEVRRLLETEIFSTYNIKTFLDCPCGDFLWMQLVKMEGVQYFGADITPITAEKNNECFKSDFRHFHVIDWSCKIPPPVDLILLRDVLFHLSTSVNLDILRHINQSGSKYLLTTTFGQFEDERGPTDRYSAEGVGYRNINLYNAPYNFPKPLTQVWEKQARRWVALYELPIALAET